MPIRIAYRYTDTEAQATVKANVKLGELQADTLANLNTIVSDATLDDSGASRTPSAHKASHQNGGGDKISVAALSGLLADDQHVLDAEVTAAINAAGVNLASGKNIKGISALTANDTWSGISAVLNAGEVLALGEAVYLKAADSEVYKALATGTTTMPGIALATCATTDGNPFEFLLHGFMRHDDWNWTPGGLLYASLTPGALTQDVSGYTTNDQVQVVGVAITADIIYFNPSFELVEIS